ncbi:MAG: hypothetical protein HYU38_07210 [Candidatus Tectomicrobia bacterium]|nr:hypothetical protein [Candidatus Tectomicrobia bacterium]
MADLTKQRLSDPFQAPRASRYSAPENGGDALPLPYGDLTTVQGVDRGVYLCPRIDTTGAGTYCVAGFGIQGTVSLFDGAGLIPPGNYTLNLANDFQGKGVIATAAFSVAPDEFVEAICKGRKDAAGALIENPASLAEEMLLNLWGFTAQEVDNRTLSTARTLFSALGYKAAGVIQEDHAPQEVLQGLLGNFLASFDVDPAGRIAFFSSGEETASIHPVLLVPSREIRARREWDLASVVNQVPVLYGKNFSFLDGRMKRHDDGETAKDAASQKLYGVRLPSQGRLSLEWVRDQAVARTIQARVVERMAEPARVVEITDESLRAIQAGEGDYAAFTVPWLRTERLEEMVNQIGQVLSVTPDLNAQRVTLRLRDTGYFLTTAKLLDGSWSLGGGALLGGGRDRVVYA